MLMVNKDEYKKHSIARVGGKSAMFSGVWVELILNQRHEPTSTHLEIAAMSTKSVNKVRLVICFCHVFAFSFFYGLLPEIKTD